MFSEKNVFFQTFEWIFLNIVTILIIAGQFQTFAIAADMTLRPYFIVIAIFFWTLHRPEILHPLTVFMIGFIYDAFLGIFLGTHSVLFISLYYILKQQRAFLTSQNQFSLFVAFILALTVFGVLEYALSCLYNFQITVPYPVLYNVLVTIFFYPLIVSFLHYLLKFFNLLKKDAYSDER